MRSIHLYIAGMGLGLGLFASCGDNTELECAPGTFKDGKSCVAVDPSDAKAPVTVASPLSQRSRTRVPFVTLRADEPATIRYTTDGSEPDATRPGEPSPVVIPLESAETTIKFFGVDANGNVEETHTETYVVDVTGPAPVTDLAVSLAGTTANVTWTNPTDADFAGALVVRVADVADGSPVDGTMYATDDALSSSVKVIGTGAISQSSDPDRATGPVRYVVWAHDDLGNYSKPRMVEAVVGTVDSAATFTYDTDTETLTQTVVPASVDLSGTTADYDLTGTTLTLHLSIKNLTTHYFQNPKILVTSVTNGLFTGSAGTADGSPFASLGPAFLAPGETRTTDLVFLNAGAATVVTIQLALGHHISLFGSGPPNRQGGGGGAARRFVDLGSGTSSTALVFSGFGRNGNRGGLTRPGRLVAHRFLDLPSSHGIERWDMSTQTLVGGAFAGEHVLSLVPSGSEMFAVVSTRKRSGPTRVVRLDEGLQTLASLDVGTRSRQGYGASAVSSDGSVLAVPGTYDVTLVDLMTFTRKDADPSSPAFDSVVTGFTETLRSVAFFGGSSGLVAIDRGGQVAIIKLGSTGTTVTPVATTGKGHAVLTAADGRVWIASDGNLRIYDPATDAVTVSAYPNGARALMLLDGQLWVLRTNRTSIDQVDATGAIQQTLTIGNTGYGHWIGVTK